ncbi:hypothetical protein Fmac_023251 [Flemingia macrophylla]|uniref:Uncharacterized protein n=1 Tax=Flemingia macrophylla TaxID=520843 RepID=A0ABD1LL00_9FABA
MILNNAISDTCMAMGEWVANPHTESALSNMLPCVDQKTTNKTLVQSKQVVANIASVVNQFIYNTANLNSTLGSLGYYNQSGSRMQPLCHPFDSQLQERQCTDQEVSSANASMLVAAVNESYALEHYTPPLLSLQNCNFVRDAFTRITLSYCPPLNHYLKIINVGLGLVSVGVLLCLVLWILYANRPRRREVFEKSSLPETTTNLPLSNANSLV